MSINNLFDYKFKKVFFSKLYLFVIYFCLLEVSKICFQECSQLTLILNLLAEVDVNLLKKFYPLFNKVKKLY